MSDRARSETKREGKDLPPQNSDKHNGGAGIAARPVPASGNLPTGGDKEIEVKEKLCRKCGETKISTAFPPNPKVRDGLSSWCRACHNAAVRACNAKKRALENAPRTPNESLYGGNQ